jgi:endo-alpha-1,4-polygalactosaminidase (GH114 family)
MQGMTREERKKEYRKAFEEWQFQRRQQERKRSEERMRLMWREALKRLLRATEQQWRLIQPKYEAELAPDREARVCARGSGGSNEQSFHWMRRSEISGAGRAKTLDEMTEGEKIVEELIDVLENENSKDEEIRRKIHALQQARDKAKGQLPKARQELRKVLTTAHQEAVFLLLGCID